MSLAIGYCFKCDELWNCSSLAGHRLQLQSKQSHTTSSARLSTGSYLCKHWMFPLNESSILLKTKPKATFVLMSGLKFALVSRQHTQLNRTGMVQMLGEKMSQKKNEKNERKKHPKSLSMNTYRKRIRFRSIIFSRFSFVAVANATTECCYSFTAHIPLFSWYQSTITPKQTRGFRYHCFV